MNWSKNEWILRTILSLLVGSCDGFAAVHNICTYLNFNRTLNKTLKKLKFCVLLVTIKLFVAFHNIFIQAHCSQQKVLLSSKEWHWFESLDSILFLPFSKVASKVKIGQNSKNRNQAKCTKKVHRSDERKE